jgi:hypothetical protein
MSSSTASFKPLRAGLPVLAVLASGLLLRSMEQRLPQSAVWRGEQMVALTGGGGLTSVLGGLRAAVAGGYWLRANLAWERRESAALEMLIGLTVAADQRPLYFWLNGARMLAYDVPAWQPRDTPPVKARHLGGEQAQRALRLLEHGLSWHGADAELHIEMANIHLRRLHDLESAARCYRLAAEQSGAPYYAARIHAELLRELGRPEEALLWLRRLLPSLPGDDPAARRDVVQARIQALERELAGR